MALNLSLSHQSWVNPITSSGPTRCSVLRSRFPRWVEYGRSSKCKEVVVKRKGMTKGQIRASLEIIGTTMDDIVGKVTQVNKDTFWPIVKVGVDKTVVLDMYTQWKLL